LSVKPGDDFQLMRAEEDKILNSHDWVDETRHCAIPIARAVEILAQRDASGVANDAAAGAANTAARRGRNAETN
jgi:hypothetical protein